MLEMAMFNVQRAITPKVGKTELWFICSARRLKALYVCVKFCEKIMNVELWSGHEYMVEMTMFHVQRAITPKVDKPELRFVCSARRLTMLYIYVKFRENI